MLFLALINTVFAADPPHWNATENPVTAAPLQPISVEVDAVPLAAEPGKKDYGTITITNNSDKPLSVYMVVGTKDKDPVNSGFRVDGECTSFSTIGPELFGCGFDLEPGRSRTTLVTFSPPEGMNVDAIGDVTLWAKPLPSEAYIYWTEYPLVGQVKTSSQAPTEPATTP